MQEKSALAPSFALEFGMEHDSGNRVRADEHRIRDERAQQHQRRGACTRM
jgi:hypothetical protein